MTFIKRADLGRPLTWDELDSNFEQVDSYAAAASASASAAQTQAGNASQSAQQALQSQQAAEAAAASAEGAVDDFKDELTSSDAGKGASLVELESGRNVQEKSQDVLTVKDFGAKGDGISNDTASLAIMADTVGFVRFNKGSYLVSDVTIDVPVIFGEGAFLICQSGSNVSITNSIESSRQWIFQGEGNYSLGNDSNSGEDSRSVHVSWFGVFPTGATETDQSVNLNKCLSSLGSSREGIVVFDIGRYTLDKTVSVPRAVEIRGKGSRRTVFNVTSNGFDVFTTQANGVKFKGIQFEPSPNLSSGYRTSGAWLNISQQLCEIEDVWVGRATQSIIIASGQCRARRIAATYSEGVGSGSFLLSIQGSDCTVEGVLVSASSFGPAKIVEIGGSASTNISNVMIDNVSFSNPSIGVSVTTSSRIISGVILRAIRCKGTSSSVVPTGIEIITTGTGSINNLSIDGVFANEFVTNCILINQGSSVSTSKISMDNIKSVGSSGIGVGFIQTAGTLSKVVVGDTVDVSTYTTPYSYSGTTSNIVVSPEANPLTNNALCYDYTIGDDSFVMIDLRRQMFTGFLLVSVGTVEYCILVVRAASSQAFTILQSSSNVNAMTGALTGNTGTDGKFSIGISNSALYFENRLGSSQRISVTTLFGIR